MSRRSWEKRRAEGRAKHAAHMSRQAELGIMRRAARPIPKLELRQLAEKAVASGARIRKIGQGISKKQVGPKPTLGQPQGSGWQVVIDPDGVVATEPIGWPNHPNRIW